MRAAFSRFCQAGSRMSEDEQHAMIGRLVAELGKAKQELALAREALTRLPARITQIEATLKDAGIAL